MRPGKASQIKWIIVFAGIVARLHAKLLGHVRCTRKANVPWFFGVSCRMDLACSNQHLAKVGMENVAGDLERNIGPAKRAEGIRPQFGRHTTPRAYDRQESFASDRFALS